MGLQSHAAHVTTEMLWHQLHNLARQSDCSYFKSEIWPVYTAKHE